MLSALGEVVDEATRAFDEFDYARALERTETFFWWFCDDYVELVKARAYGSRGDGPAASARAALRRGLDTLLRLFAPFLPFATEEAWSWWHTTSVHRASWPSPVSGDAEATTTASLDPTGLATICSALGQVRRAKTEAKQSQRATVARLVVTANAEMLAAIDIGRHDLIEAGSITELVLEERASDSNEIATQIELATED